MELRCDVCNFKSATPQNKQGQCPACEFGDLRPVQESAQTKRTSWDEYFLQMAEMAASRATCKRAQHGAVIVQDKAVVSTGYNGAPARIQSCEERDICIRAEAGCAPGEKYELCHGSHAEMNAICLAAKNGNRVAGSTIYVTGLPCLICTRLIINAGILRVVYRSTGRYADIGSTELLNAAGISCIAL